MVQIRIWFFLIILFTYSLTWASAIALRSSGKTQIEVHLIFSTLEGIPLESGWIQEQIVQQIEEEWGKAFEAQGIRLIITHKTMTSEKVLEHISKSHNLSMNYVFLSKDPKLLWSFVIGNSPGGNIAFFKIPTQEKTLTKVFAHEFGHILGLDHPKEKTGIMFAPSSEKERQDPKFYLSPSKEEVQTVLSQIRWQDREGEIGHLSVETAEISPMQYPTYFQYVFKLIQAQGKSTK